MRIQKFLLLSSFGLGLCCATVSAQEQEISIGEDKAQIQHSLIQFIDEQQKNYSAHIDSIREHIDPHIADDPEALDIIKRINQLKTAIPLAYNVQVKSYIDKYSSQNWRPYMNKLMGLSGHFFPVYEQVFEELHLPDELKYLSVVESSLDPHLVSTSGAVGPWQFMYATAKFYDLDMNSYVDERKDVYAATYAVSRYLREAHDQFGDWLVALASYNCGRGCVKRAIERSGMHNPTFWELAPYLPQETRNYIPKFIAMTYVLRHADYYDIVASPTDFDARKKMVMVDNVVDLNAVSQAVNVPLAQLKKINPSYKKNIVNGTAEKPKRLLIPLTDNMNDSLLYVALHAPANMVLAVADVSKPANTKSKPAAKSSKSTIVYTVKRGDSLDRIANRHRGVSVSKLKADNGLRSSNIKPGQKLKIRLN